QDGGRATAVLALETDLQFVIVGDAARGDVGERQLQGLAAGIERQAGGAQLRIEEVGEGEHRVQRQASLVVVTRRSGEACLQELGIAAQPELAVAQRVRGKLRPGEMIEAAAGLVFHALENDVAVRIERGAERGTGDAESLDARAFTIDERLEIDARIACRRPGAFGIELDAGVIETAGEGGIDAPGRIGEPFAEGRRHEFGDRELSLPANSFQYVREPPAELRAERLLQAAVYIERGEIAFRRKTCSQRPRQQRGAALDCQAGVLVPGEREMRITAE